MNPVLLVIAGPNGAGGASIAFETVFSTLEKVEFVRRARDAGYFVRVLFIGTADPRINAARVAGRVMEGELPAWVVAALDGVPRHADFVDLRAA